MFAYYHATKLWLTRKQGYTVFSIPVGVLYRPNAAKVKNLKTKDYLGKARVVLASDRIHGSEAQWKPMMVDRTALDGREGVSFAATNLVHADLRSRSRQHSEPPLNRNVFPPTPPPDADRATGNSAAPGGSGQSIHNRSASVRAARPPRLELDRTGSSLDRRPGAQGIAPTEKPRIGTTRTASEPRGPPAHHNMRGFAQDSGRRETAGHRRNLSDTNFPPTVKHGDTGSDDAYSNPRNMANASWGRGARYQPPQYIDEQDEYSSDPCDGDALNDDFEIVGTNAGPSPVQQRRMKSPTRGARRGNSRRPEIRRFRTKVHAPVDTRYIMIGATIEFAGFEARIREKFGFRCPLKMKVQDDGDMITMVDQEDLELLLSSAREVARRERSEMGKMEVSLIACLLGDIVV